PVGICLLQPPPRRPTPVPEALLRAMGRDPVRHPRAASLARRRGDAQQSPPEDDDMTRIFMRHPDVTPEQAKEVLLRAGVRNIASLINTDPKFLKNIDNHTTVYIVTTDTNRAAMPWFTQCGDLLRQTSATVYWFDRYAVLWSTKPYVAGA